MATTNDVSTSRPPSVPARAASALTGTGSAGSTRSRSSASAGRSRSSLEQAIEASRVQLLQAQGVLKCLYEVLLHAEAEESLSYAETAEVAVQLIDEASERLDNVRLRPLIEALVRRGGSAERSPAAGSLRVEECFAPSTARSTVWILR